MSFAPPLVAPRDFTDVYFELVEHLTASSSPVIQANGRTGTRVAVARGPQSFLLDLTDGLLPVCGMRRLFPRTAAAEVAWFLMGQDKVTWLRRYAPIWDKFVEDDGMTVRGAYGYRWRNHFGRDQVNCALYALQKDPSDRRVYVSAWDPGVDGLGRPNQKNVPCPVGFTLSIAGGELHSALMIRSSDVFVGLPYDVMGHALLLDAFAAELGVELGTMHVTLAHAHLYETHWEMACHGLGLEPVFKGPKLPRWALRSVEERPDDYVAWVAELARQVPWPDFNPRPEVVA